MEKLFLKYVANWDKNLAPNNTELKRLINKIDFNINTSFLLFYELFNGANAITIDHEVLVLWCIDDILALNPYYDDIEECKAFFFFGANGSNGGYAFDKIKNEIVFIDFFDIGLREALFISKTFEEFIKLFKSEQ